MFAGHGRDVTDVDCTGDSEKFISSSWDKSGFLWGVPNTTVLRRFRGHAGRVNCVKLNEEGTIAVSGSVDGTARIWDLRSRSYEPIQGKNKTHVCIYKLYLLIDLALQGGH